MSARPKSPAEAAIEVWPSPARNAALQTAVWIREGADKLAIGPLEETLKWGEPAFLPQVSGVGTTIRLAWKSKKLNALQFLVHCQTALIERWRSQFPDVSFDKNRAVLLPLDERLPEQVLHICIADALTYHRGRTQ